MKKISIFLSGLFFFSAMGSANASLTTIGTAQFNGSGTAYNLIYDDDNNGKSLIWLDYTHSSSTWLSQINWAAGLNTSLTYNINPAYTVDWGANSWRLPSTVDGQYVIGWDGTTTGGYNITSSEMGHLYYGELGNKGYQATNGSFPQPGWGLNNKGDFSNLMDITYWSGTEYASDPLKSWRFGMRQGNQGITGKVDHDNKHSGLAVHTAQVSTVPVPGAALFLGSGLLGLAGLGRRKKAAVA